MRNIIKSIRGYKNQIVLCLLMILIAVIGYQYFSKYFYAFKDPKKIKNIIISYGKYSTIAFAALQFLQVVVFFIPGEIVQIAGGYIFGTLNGMLISLVGVILGTLFGYCVAHYFGKPLLDKIIDKKSMNYFERILNYGKIDFVVFLLYIIPGVPKDALSYICGISKIKLKRFMIISTIGRIPGMVISSYFGSNINSGNNKVLIAIAVAAILLFAMGVYKGEDIIRSMLGGKSDGSDGDG